MAESTAMSNRLLEDDDSILRHTQGVRLQVVDQLMDQGKIPVTQEDRDLLIKVIDGIDRQAIAKKRIKSDSKIGDAAQQAAAALAIMAQRMGGKNPFKADNSAAGPDKVPDKFTKGDVTIVPGELDIGDDTRTFEDFQKEHDGKM